MEGPANPALRTEKWHPEFQEELSRVACALRDLTGTRCLPGCEGAGFRADTLPWCWALPQASRTWGMWFLKEQGWLSGEHCSVPSLEIPLLLSEQHRPLLQVPARKTPSAQLGKVLWLLLLPRNPFCCPGRAGPAHRHKSFTPWTALELNPASSGIIAPALIWNFNLRREEK